jgi:RNA polymerase sigma-70 factor (ECF subfamily)
MSAGEEDFRSLMRGVLAGDPDATDRLCRTYQSAILRVVRHRLAQRLRARFDSLDFVHDVWASFFAKPPADVAFARPEELIGYLERMAQFKVGEEARRQIETRKHGMGREMSLHDDTDEPDARLYAREPTPSQVAAAEDEWERMLRGRPPLHQSILHALRNGMTYREIAEKLHTNEKTIQRLVRRLDPGDAYA